MGRPVIATDHGGARETILPRRDRLAGAAGRCRGARRRARRRRSICRDPSGGAMAERAIAHVRAHFTTERMTDRTLAVYEEILFPDAAQLDPRGPVAA